MLQAAGLAPTVEQAAFKGAYQGGALGLGVVLPVMLQVVSLLGGRGTGWLAVPAALASLAGGYAERSLIVFAGNESADSPEIYHRVTAPGATATTPSPTVVQDLDARSSGRLG